MEHFFSGITKYLMGVYQRKLKKYDYIVTVANEMQVQLKDIYPDLAEEKIKMIYNPFDLEKIQGKSE